MRFLKFALAGACALGLVGLSPANSAEPVKIRMSWVAPVANWASIILEKKDLAVHLGKSYTLESVRYQGTPQMITAIANNELEVSNLAYSSLAIAIENAGLDDIRVIADEFQDGVPGYFSEQFYVRKDSGINKVEDLKGKVIATNGGGSAVDVAMRAMLKKHGLEEKRDYTMIEAPLPTMAAVLSDKKADLVPAVLPFALNPKLKEEGKVLFEQREAIGITQMIVWTARKSFIDKNRAAMVDFMEDMLRITRWYLDPEEPRRSGQDRIQHHKGAARTLRLALHQGRYLPRSEPVAERRGVAAQRRHDAGPGLREKEDRHQEICRREPGAGSCQAPEIAVTPFSRRNGPGILPGPFLFGRNQMRLSGMAPRKSRLPTSTPKLRAAA